MEGRILPGAGWRGVETKKQLEKKSLKKTNMPNKPKPKHRKNETKKSERKALPKDLQPDPSRIGSSAPHCCSLLSLSLHSLLTLVSFFFCIIFISFVYINCNLPLPSLSDSTQLLFLIIYSNSSVFTAIMCTGGMMAVSPTPAVSVNPFTLRFLVFFL